MRRMNANAVLVTFLMPCVVPVTALHAEGITREMEFLCRRTDGTEYPVSKTYTIYYNPADDTCYNGQPWCAKTGHSQTKLVHAHFLEDFTSEEQLDAERYICANYGIIGTLDMPTTDYNCHAYALYRRQDVWIFLAYGDTPDGFRDDIADDFVAVAGTEADPYCEGHVCRYGNNDHTSIIYELLSPTGQPADAAKMVKAKWGGHGKYKTSDSENYGHIGDPDSIWKPKP
ncbi:MAG: hypothetical protein GW892_30800 [Armatimonadetes bacterium]|nr:hypothetical protein [Armatimonadota bacterium]NCQ31987.1 hypothetical protein [Armatimonadota bacterium]